MKNKAYTKAESLQFLAKYEKKLSLLVPKFFFITKKTFYIKENFILQKIKENFSNKKIIIRSSALSEDIENNSNAGKFKSFGNIKSNNKKEIKKLISYVIEDFENENDQILIQEYIEKPKVSGVIFTRDIKTNSPYTTINYDLSGKTNLITSGSINPTMKTLTIFNSKLHDKKFFGINFNFLKKLQKIYRQERLDIEFCIRDKKIYIFQCRPLKKTRKVRDLVVKKALINIEKKFKKLNKPVPFLYGDYTLFSNMCDWNPAEMIGTKPKPLAASLYSELITDYIWSKQRANFGYKNVEPHRLMINLAGAPYIDVRTDFNSFLPSKLPEKIQKKAIKFYLDKLKKYPSRHDKIEFEIIETCYDFDLDRKFKKFLTFKEKKIYIKELKELTNKILNTKNNILSNQIEKSMKLEKRIDLIKGKKLSEIQKIYFLIDDCKKFGTLPFAGLARCAFIYTKLLKSLVKNKILSKKDYQNFYESCETITKQMNKEVYYIKKNKNKKIRFLKKFGHLRPSTYSIISKNYKEHYSKYFNKIKLDKPKKIKKFNLPKQKMFLLNKMFKKNGLQTNAGTFFSEAKKAIEMREFSKFIFTKSINAIFDNLIILGKEINISRSDLEYLSIKNFINYYNNLNSTKLKELLNNEIKENKKEEKMLNLINMPDFLSNINDLYYYFDWSKEANYITDKNISGRIIELKSVNDFNQLDNKIVLLRNADPGFDFIFSRKLKGLVTCYGGANSHMAIRCLELEIPAIIGTGPKIYNEILKSNSIEINCQQGFYKKIN